MGTSHPVGELVLGRGCDWAGRGGEGKPPGRRGPYCVKVRDVRGRKSMLSEWWPTFENPQGPRRGSVKGVEFYIWLHITPRRKRRN